MAYERFPCALYKDDEKLDPIVVNDEAEYREKKAQGWKDRPMPDPSKKEDYDPNTRKVIAVEFQKFPCAVYHPDGRAEIAKDEDALDKYLAEGWAEKKGEWNRETTLEKKIAGLQKDIDEAEAELAALRAEKAGNKPVNVAVEAKAETKERLYFGKYPAKAKK
jgi:hypothetical protein